MRSRAAVAWGRGEPWSIEDIDVDRPGPGEVLVEWAAAGLCHSDEHFRSGDRVPAELDDEMYPLLGVGRGSLLDETALITALRDGQLAAAALDVASAEP